MLSLFLWSWRVYPAWCENWFSLALIQSKNVARDGVHRLFRFKTHLLFRKALFLVVFVPIRSQSAAPLQLAAIRPRR